MLVSNILVSSSTDDKKDVDDDSLVYTILTYLTDIAAAAESAQTSVEGAIITLRRRLYDVRAFFLSSAESQTVY